MMQEISQRIMARQDLLETTAENSDQGREVAKRIVMRVLHPKRGTSVQHSRGVTISEALAARREDEYLWR